MGQDQSKSGLGSTKQYSKNFLSNLKKVIEKYNIQTLYDLSCGDAYWISQLFPTLKKYVGVDVSDFIIQRNKKRYQQYSNVEFINDDILSFLKKTKKLQLRIIRQTFEHLNNEYIFDCLKKLKVKAKKRIITCSNDVNQLTDIGLSQRGRRVNLNLSQFKKLLPRPTLKFWDSVGDKKDKGYFGYLYEFK